MKYTLPLLILSLLAIAAILFNPGKEDFDEVEHLQYCKEKMQRYAASVSEEGRFPRSIKNGDSTWNTSSSGSWTSGFFPSMLWLMYELTSEPEWKLYAEKYNEPLGAIRHFDWKTHDFGFMVYNPLVQGYKQTGDEWYKEVITETADSLAVLYNPNVGTVLSWPWMSKKRQWPHNTIIDNMMNIEMLFWVASKTQNTKLYDMAYSHAYKTMEHQFQDDFTAFHVVVYDSITGKVLQRVTDQGYNDHSMWARGQAWAIYGYVMTYRYTGDKVFLDFAEKISHCYLKKLPKDKIPYWDMKLPSTKDEPRDASSAAIVASALIELSLYTQDKKYHKEAIDMLKSLSKPPYRASEKIDAFLLSSTGSKPGNSEVDTPLIYADYYYLEALMRLHWLKNKNQKWMQVPV